MKGRRRAKALHTIKAAARKGRGLSFLRKRDNRYTCTTSGEMDFERAGAIIDQAKNLVISTPYGDAQAIQRFEVLARELVVVCDRNAVIHRKCESAMDFVRIAFDSRDQRSYNREKAAHFATRDLIAAENHLHDLERVQKPP